MTDELPSAEDAQKLLEGTTRGPWRKRDCDVVVGEGLTAKLTAALSHIKRGKTNG